MTPLDVHVIHKPSVYVVGRVHVDDATVNRFLADNGITWESDAEHGSEKLVEVAGRVCYMSFAAPRPGGNKAYLHHILEVGHGSVTEHAAWNMILAGISRSCSHELVRHRHFSYSQLSQRYVDESVAEYVEPDIIAGLPDAHKVWLESVSESHRAYVRLVDILLAKVMWAELYRRGLGSEGQQTWDRTLSVPECLKLLKPEERTAVRKEARQAARSVLPNATETKVFTTMNVRAARNFIELRCSEFAEPEIRKLGNAVLEALQSDCPALFSDYQRQSLPDGSFAVTTEYPKV